MSYELSAAILCGGKSSRMGFDKAFLRLDQGQGPYLLEIVSRSLLARFSEVVLVTDHPDKLTKIGGLSQCRIVSDIFPQSGLIGAIYTAIHLCVNPGVFILPCDMAHIPWPLLEHICTRGTKCDVLVTIHDGFVEPLFSLYSKTAGSAFFQALEKSEKTVRRVYDTLQIDYVEPQKIGLRNDCFENINYPEDLKKLRMRTDS